VARRILADLWWTLAPLLVPALGILLIASLAWSWPATLLAFLVVGAVAGAGLLRLWRRSSRRAVRTVVTTRPYKLLIGLLVILLVSAGLFWALASQDRFVDGYDLWSRALVAAGFVLWTLAALLRLPIFLTTLRRRVFALVFVVAAARYYLWLFVGGDTDLAVIDHATWGLLLLALLAIVWWRERSHGAPKTTWKTGDYGAAMALLAAGVFVVAGSLAMSSDPPIERVKLRFEVVKASDFEAPPDVTPWVNDPETLARRFSPRLELTDGERWRPMAVGGFLSDADLYDQRDRVIEPPPLTPDDLKRSCPAEKPLCYEITIHCSLKQSDDGECEDGPKSDGRTGVAYARVVRKSELDGDEAATVFSAESPYPDLSILVQYWLFYYYDDWHARTIFGQLRQGHEADWEVVTIGFSTREPLFVALSAHCAGTWLPWKDMRLAKLSEEPTHPMVAVAEGSQALYHDPEANIPPNWARCNGVSETWVETANLAYKIRDRTGVSEVLALDLEMVDDDTPEMSFPGWWGRHNTTQFETAFGRTYELEKEGHGPESPARKTDWATPVHEIFCTRGWKWVGAGRRPKTSCQR
jgi:hypothetical protein